MALAREAVEGIDPAAYRGVCLPDLFVDLVVQLPPLADTFQRIRAVHDRGGGNLRAHQELRAGGNAANTAYHLAGLGVETWFHTRTSPSGSLLLQETLGQAGVHLDLVEANGTLATTAALEMGPERTNVMFNDPAGLAELSPD
ncbi:MAG: hypothetical protein R3185_05095, partial [Candidatus Thermoplasmatota archaeon]|nr:hypothetical protein [Candidatus Thermoplasmatota archaeon]